MKSAVKIGLLFTFLLVFQGKSFAQEPTIDISKAKPVRYHSVNKKIYRRTFPEQKSVNTGRTSVKRTEHAIMRKEMRMVAPIK